MATGLTTFARTFLVDEETFRKRLDYPVLLWEAPSRQGDDALMPTATGGNSADAPRPGEPLVFPIKRSSNKSNAFLMGISVGRTDNNDLIIENISVSRFHAYFLKDARTGEWKLVDVSSKNGTWVGDQPLAPNTGVGVPDKTTVRFGSVELVFLLPPSLLDYLRRHLRPE